jgi:O-Antigen ligase
VRARLPVLAAAPILLGPAALAFAKGGYFDEARLWAAVAAWVLVAAVLAGGARPLPSGPGRLALAGLAALTAWTGISILWAPVAGPALDSLQRDVLYLGALLAAVPLLRDGAVRRATEPVLLAGIVAAAGYGLSERLLPGIVSLEQIASAADRLNQPLTYWNAMGALCTLGLVLAAGLLADATRSPALRAAAAAAAPPIGLSLYATFSRGALGAGAAGLAVLVALAPQGRTARAALLVAAAAAVPALATVALPAVKAPGGSAAQGAAMLAVLAVTMAGAAKLAGPVADRGAALPGRLLRQSALALLAVALVVSGAAAVRAEGRGGVAPTGADAKRLVSVQSNRYAYWKVAARTFADHPVAGVGAGGFAVAWLRERDIAETVRDAHSLYIETAAELGLIGLAALALLVLGALRSAGAALRRAGPPAAGAAAALAAWALHAALDWDWEMPALTLVAVVLLARLAAEAEPVSARSGSAAARARP